MNALRAFAARALTHVLDKPAPATSDLEQLEVVSVILVSDARMAALHKKFMNIEGATDVITFQHGEIFISAETAARNAREFQTATEHEIRLYLVHGLLHLHGFDDTSALKARIMQRVQTRLLAAAMK